MVLIIARGYKRDCDARMFDAVFVAAYSHDLDAIFKLRGDLGTRTYH
jgi:hypothetical protein